MNEALTEYEKRAKLGKARNKEVSKYKKMIKEKEKESVK
jgi:hypothetical protein